MKLYVQLKKYAQSWSPIIVLTFLLFFYLFNVWLKPIRETRIIPDEELQIEKIRMEVEKIKRENISQSLQGIAALGFIVTAWFSYKTLQKERGKASSERFGQAVNMLSNRQQLEHRLGGIYSLGELAKDFPENYHFLVVEILAAFIREHSPYQRNQEDLLLQKDISSIDSPKNLEEVPNDIRVAISMICQLRTRNNAFEKEFARLDLRLTNLPKVELSKGYLRCADFCGSNLDRIDAYKVNLSQAILEKVSMRYANFDFADLSEASLKSADLSFSRMKQANLKEANLQHANLSNTSMFGVNLYRATLQDAVLENAILQSIQPIPSKEIDSWVETDLSCTKFERATLKGADLRGVNLAKASLVEADLTGANLSPIEKRNYRDKVDLDFKSPRIVALGSFQSTKLNDANFRRAILVNADLSFSIMNGANFEEADLEGANLEKADLEGAIFYKANVRPEQLFKAKNWRNAEFDPEIKQKLEELYKQKDKEPTQSK